MEDSRACREELRGIQKPEDLRTRSRRTGLPASRYLRDISRYIVAIGLNEKIRKPAATILEDFHTSRGQFDDAAATRTTDPDIARHLILSPFLEDARDPADRTRAPDVTARTEGRR